MKIKKSFNSLWLLILIPISLLLTFLARTSPSTVEKLYSRGIYRPISQAISLITGILPISIAEVSVLLIILIVIVIILKVIMKAISGNMNRYIIFNYLKKMAVFISVMYFVFYIIWGLNYYRLPFSEISNIKTSPTTIEELEALCEYLIDKTNTIRSKIDSENNNVFDKTTYTSIFKRANKGYKIAAEIYPALGGKYGNPKGVLLSRGMSYTGITGIYFPFTAEANVNIDIPHAMIPSTAVHEMAHQRGFAREDEANYIAHMVCRLHPDMDFQYSGYLLALIHSMNALHDNDRDKFIELSSRYNILLKKDLFDMNTYWEGFAGPVEKVSNKINDTYLKANDQKDGVKSYGRMVDLLIAELRAENKQNQ